MHRFFFSEDSSFDGEKEPSYSLGSSRILEWSGMECGDTYVYADQFSHLYPHINTNRDQNQDTHTYRHPDGHPYDDTNLHLHAYTNCDAHSHHHFNHHGNQFSNAHSKHDTHHDHYALSH